MTISCLSIIDLQAPQTLMRSRTRPLGIILKSKAPKRKQEKKTASDCDRKYKYLLKLVHT